MCLLQGFLCPLCMQSFKSAELLQTHFDSSHGDMGEPVSRASESSHTDSSVCSIVLVLIY